jgi:hypothetical protein
MTRHAAVLYAARPGYPLDTKVELELENDSTGFIGESMEFLSRRLHALGLTNFYFNVVGFGNKDSARVFDGSRSTMVHEEAHRDLRAYWSIPESSFDESLAHAVSDVRFADQDTIAKRRSLSRRLPRLYRAFSSRLRNGGLGKDGQELLNTIVDIPKYNRSQDNWATFLRTFEGFRHYDMFMDILEMDGPGHGMEEIFSVAGLVSETGDVEEAVLLLEDYLRLRGKEVQFDEEVLTVRDPDLWDFESAIEAGSNEGGYRILAQTSNWLATPALREVLGRRKAKFKRLGDR